MEAECDQNYSSKLFELGLMKEMRIRGAVNFLWLGLILMLVLIVGAFALAKEEPGSVAAQFMSALAKHDVEKLTDLSYIGKTEPAEIESSREKLKKSWDFCVNTAGKHYTFAWRTSASRKSSENSASVTLQVQRNIANGGSYDEKYELPMEQEGGKWKVVVSGISSDMFPGLPR
jgi:hypothetical protein